MSFKGLKNVKLGKNQRIAVIARVSNHLIPAIILHFQITWLLELLTQQLFIEESWQLGLLLDCVCIIDIVEMLVNFVGQFASLLNFNVICRGRGRIAFLRHFFPE